MGVLPLLFPLGLLDAMTQHVVHGRDVVALIGFDTVYHSFMGHVHDPHDIVYYGVVDGKGDGGRGGVRRALGAKEGGRAFHDILEKKDQRFVLVSGRA